MSDYSFAAWQRALREASRRNVITASAAHTALWLETFADHKTGLNARPSVETLADIQQVKVDTIRRNLALLRRAGFIHRTHGHSRNRPATYRMVIPLSPGDSLQDVQSGDESPTWIQSGGQSGGQSGDERGVTTVTSLTTNTSATYASDQRSDRSHEKQLGELLDALVEAVNGEYVSLPYTNIMDTEQQVKRVLNDLIPALRADGIDQPVPYLLAINDKDGSYCLGLAIREKWRALVGVETR